MKKNTDLPIMRSSMVLAIVVLQYSVSLLLLTEVYDMYSHYMRGINGYVLMLIIFAIPFLLFMKKGRIEKLEEQYASIPRDENWIMSGRIMAAIMFAPLGYAIVRYVIIGYALKWFG